MSDALDRLIPIRERSSVGEIADQLRARILDGTFSAGSQIFEGQLADRLGMSRGPVREAIQRLVQEGLLVNRRNRGVRVVQFGPADVEDIYASRKLIEREATRQLHASGNEAAMRRLEELIDTMAAVARAEDWAQLAECDLTFHETVVASTGSPRLVRMFSTLAAETRICLNALSGSYPEYDTLVDEHRRLLVLLRDGDEADVLAAVDKHLTLTKLPGILAESDGSVPQPL